jgi:hypothetical protein
MSWQHGVTLHGGRKSDKKSQSPTFLSSFTHSFIIFESMHIGQKYHDTNMQAWLYHDTQGLPGLG